jgi:hypothetical protein
MRGDWPPKGHARDRPVWLVRRRRKSLFSRPPADDDEFSNAESCAGALVACEAECVLELARARICGCACRAQAGQPCPDAIGARTALADERLPM